MIERVDVGAPGGVQRAPADRTSRRLVAVMAAAYMTAYFAGGAVASAGSAAAYGAWGWTGVCALGAAFGAAGVLLWAVQSRPGARR